MPCHAKAWPTTWPNHGAKSLRTRRRGAPTPASGEIRPLLDAEIGGTSPPKPRRLQRGRFPIGLQRPGTPPNRGDTCRQWPSRAGTRIRAMKTWGRPYVFIGRWRVPPRDGHFRRESPRFGGVPGRWRPIGNRPSEADAVSAETSHRFPRRAIGEFRLMPASVPRAASAGHRRPRRRRAPTPA